MGTKAVDETADTAGAGAEAEVDLKKGEGADEAESAAGAAKVSPAAAEADEVAKADGAAADGELVDGAADEVDDDEADDEDDEFEAAAADAAASSAGVGQGAGAVVAAALGVVGLSGGWLGTVASARESLMGQLKTSQGASVAQQVQEVYGDSWKTTALVGGLFALAALVVGAGVLVRPAFGEPGRPQAPWIKSVAWAGVALGVIGLLLAIAKYTNVLLDLPSTS
ncbi:hypothetical protein [Streptomyces flavofungini]|uniref:Integral membrane protein n=1 Tax=Streptomyces flavofungini TaxID=68200 RepID=A0ABS0WZK9_9ACTN|nr:hypothetical protein [Streptomyces flavofungini]MBJ3806362.1 hypothetical protein [Streptomyces flavofungini]GHC45654.1 hypothetical protein GCM10010349_07970 [Streptomyces flavofungini]